MKLDIVRLSIFVNELIREFANHYKSELSRRQRLAEALWKKAESDVRGVEDWTNARNDESAGNYKKYATEVEDEIRKTLVGLPHLGVLINETDWFGEKHHNSPGNVRFLYPHHNLN